jgi:hypothetical protein
MNAPLTDKPLTALERARAFFDRNPDEVLTRADLQLKLDCCKRTATSVAKALIREGVRRDQLPRNGFRERPVRTPKAFPDNLTPAQRGAVEGLIAHGTIGAAAVAAGLADDTIVTYLRDARRKAGVRKTVDLVEKYRAATGA